MLFLPVIKKMLLWEILRPLLRSKAAEAELGANAIRDETPSCSRGLPPPRSPQQGPDPHGLLMFPRARPPLSLVPTSL